MQTTQLRFVVLIALLAVGNMLAITSAHPAPALPARWPSDDAAFAVGGWTMGPLRVEEADHGVHNISREYRRPGGVVALLTITTTPRAKDVYRHNADVPFLGNGFAVGAAPPGVATPADSGAFLATRQQQPFLVFYAQGERRGLMGEKVTGWGLVALDAFLHRPNDYYKLTLYSPIGRAESQATHEVAALAAALFPQIAAWYGR